MSRRRLVARAVRNFQCLLARAERVLRAQRASKVLQTSRAALYNGSNSCRHLVPAKAAASINSSPECKRLSERLRDRLPLAREQEAQRRHDLPAFLRKLHKPRWLGCDDYAKCLRVGFCLPRTLLQPSFSLRLRRLQNASQSPALLRAQRAPMNRKDSSTYPRPRAPRFRRISSRDRPRR